MNNIQIECDVCHTLFGMLEIESHEKVCYEQQIKMLNDLSLKRIENLKEPQYTYPVPELTEIQKYAIKFVMKKSKL